jgi:dTDP-4-amino-4,6-dideoxygalactose transaminase
MDNNCIYLSLAQMSGSEQKYIQEAFDTNWVVPLGPNVDAFEKSLQDFFMNSNERLTIDQKYVVALSSGTAAIHLGLLQLGVQLEDEVICQSFTFAASANPIRYLGANPVFVDSESDTWNMSPIYLEEAIEDRIRITGKKPKAIIPVHLYGMPVQMDKIVRIADYYKVPLLEDAAEALGSTYKGQKCGTFGDFACLSFNGNKMITTSGGGALVCSTKEQVEKTKFYATQARDNAPHYQHSEIGYNDRMSNICAGIGRGQMFVLEEHIARRREIHQLYTDLLRDIPGITVIQNPSHEFNSNFWLTCILIDKKVLGLAREEMRLIMEAVNIETRPLWKPMHLQPVFKDAPFYGDGTSEQLFERGLCLPSGSGLTNEDIMRVVDVIKNVINQ